MCSGYNEHRNNTMKTSLIILYIFAFFGLVVAGNLIHEGYHYFDLKQNPNIKIKDFCVFAIPIPENNYREFGFVSFNYENVSDIPKSSELNATIVQYAFIIFIVFLFSSYRNKEEIKIYLKENKLLNK
jgi:hypothetical protein